MAEAALVRDMQVPNGGIADFVMSDEDIEAVYGPDEDEGAEEYGTKGLGQFTEIANQMAEKGRYGDDTIAHVETGELVIPKAFLEQDPEMAETLFAYLESMGIEDPQRYVVGSEANSINPETGLPEFFFKKVFRKAKKAVKKVTKAVSKIAKPVIKVIQKVAPIVLPMALSATPLGPVFGAALGSGIASLINGGSLKDAFKKALIGGAMGAAGAGFRSLATGGGFMEGITGAVSNPVARFGQTFTGAQNSLTRLVGGAVAPEAPGFFGKFVEPVATEAATGAATEAATSAATEAGTIEAAKSSVPALDPAFSSDFAYTSQTTPALDSFSAQTPTLSNFQAPELTDAAQSAGLGQFGDGAGQERTTLQTVGDYMFRGGQSPEQIAQTAEAAKQAAIQKSLESSAAAGLSKTDPSVVKTALAAGQSAFEAAQPGYLTTLGPSLALAGGAAYASGALDSFFTPPPQEDVGLVERDEQGNVITGQTILKERPQDFLVRDLGDRVFNPATGEYELVQNLDPRSANYASYLSPTSFKYDIFQPGQAAGPFQRPEQPPVFAAEGGHIFPRRNGGIMPNEGIPNQDSVRAMLMPGEFVMTTDAVRGAGNGSLNRGIKNMYSVMRNLESRGRRLA